MCKNTFLELNKKTFCQFITKHTQNKIKVTTSRRLYLLIKKKVEKQAHISQFGVFLSELDMDSIDNDWQHILNWHINNGNEITIANAFRFFAKAVHYEDKESQTKDCKSVFRHQKRR
eukprot:541486_1